MAAMVKKGTVALFVPRKEVCASVELWSDICCVLVGCDDGMI